MLNALLAWLFYNSVFGAVLFPAVVLFVYKSKNERNKRKAGEKFDKEYKDMLVSVSDGLSSGYSIENAFKDSEENIRMMYGKESVILNDLKEINAKIAMRIPAEKAFLEFAYKNPTEETLAFAGMFSFARRLGGEYVKNLRSTIEKMEAKLELKQEIKGNIAEKQMEFRLMSIMPIGILIYVKLTSGDFLSNAYGNIPGVAVMSICLVLYLVSVLLGKRIVDIEV